MCIMITFFSSSSVTRSVFSMDKDLVMAIEKLKEVRRKGWVDSGIKDAESVADHTCAVALCVLFASLERKDIDLKKALTMALIHDLAESIVGDITPFDGIPKREKLVKERKALESILSSLSRKKQTEILGIWKELNEGKSPEARLVLEADVFERLAQAKVYEGKGYKVDRFFSAVKGQKGTAFEAVLMNILR